MLASPRPKKRARPPLGPPVEVWVWRITPQQTGRGEHRKLIDNLLVQGWDHFWQQRDPGAGRYRVELRDARRAIVKVRYYEKQSRREGGRVIATTGRRRPSKRRVPPAVAGWDPDAPRATPREASSPQSPRIHVLVADPASPARPSLTPPREAPAGAFWRLRKNGKWNLITADVPLTPAYVSLRLPTGEYIFVYSPKRRWPGYELVTLNNGAPCLVPQAR